MILVLFHDLLGRNIHNIQEVSFVEKLVLIYYIDKEWRLLSPKTIRVLYILRSFRYSLFPDVLEHISTSPY